MTIMRLMAGGYLLGLTQVMHPIVSRTDRPFDHHHPPSLHARTTDASFETCERHVLEE